MRFAGAESKIPTSGKGGRKWGTRSPREVKSPRLRENSLRGLCSELCDMGSFASLRMTVGSMRFVLIGRHLSRPARRGWVESHLRESLSMWAPALIRVSITAK